MVLGESAESQHVSDISVIEHRTVMCSRHETTRAKNTCTVFRKCGKLTVSQLHERSDAFWLTPG